MHNHAIMLLCNVLSAGVSDVLTGVTTDSEMDPHTRISTGAALGRNSEASALFWNTGAEISFYSYWYLSSSLLRLCPLLLGLVSDPGCRRISSSRAEIITEIRNEQQGDNADIDSIRQ